MKLRMQISELRGHDLHWMDAHNHLADPYLIVSIGTFPHGLPSTPPPLPHAPTDDRGEPIPVLGASASPLATIETAPVFEELNPAWENRRQVEFWVPSMDVLSASYLEVVCFDMDFQSEHEEIGHARISLADLATGHPNRLLQLRLHHRDRGRISLTAVVEQVCDLALSLGTVRLDRSTSAAAMVDLEGAYLALAATDAGSGNSLFERTTEPCLFHQLPSWDAKMFGRPHQGTYSLQQLHAVALTFHLCINHGETRDTRASLVFPLGPLLDACDIAQLEAHLDGPDATLHLDLPFVQDLVLNSGQPIGPFSGTLSISNFPRLRQKRINLVRLASLRAKIASETDKDLGSMSDLLSLHQGPTFITDASPGNKSPSGSDFDSDYGSSDSDSLLAASLGLSTATSSSARKQKRRKKKKAARDQPPPDLMAIEPDPHSSSGDESDGSIEDEVETYEYRGPITAIQDLEDALRNSSWGPVTDALTRLARMEPFSRPAPASTSSTVFKPSSKKSPPGGGGGGGGGGDGDDDGDISSDYSGLVQRMQGSPPLFLPLHLLASLPDKGSLLDACIERIGFDPGCVSPAGLTPLDVAVRSGHEGNMNILLRHLASRSVRVQQVFRERAIDAYKARREREANAAAGSSGTPSSSRRGRARVKAGGRTGAKRTRGGSKAGARSRRSTRDSSDGGSRGGRKGRAVRRGGAGPQDVNGRDTTTIIPVVDPRKIFVEDGAEEARRETLFSVCRDPAYEFAGPLIQHYGHALVDAVDESGNTALHLVAAVKEGDVKSKTARDVMSIARDLLATGIPIDAQRVDGATALSLTLAVGSFMLADVLLEAGADVNLADTKGQSALIIAVQMGLDGMIEKLLSHNADPNVCNAESESALHIAAAFNKYSAIPRLLQASKYGALQDAYAMRLDNKGRSPLHVAALHGQLDALEELLNYPALDITLRDKDGKTALELAKNDDVRRELQAHGATKENDALLLRAADDGDVGTVQRLVQPIEPGSSLRLSFADATHPVTSLTALHFAARRGHCDVIRVLLEAGADPNSVFNLMGWSPLYSAAYHGHVDAVRLLLSAGADPTVYDLDGMTPLHVAASKNLQSMISVLLAGGAELEARTHAGWTPLHVAAFNSRLEAVRDLIGHGADPKAIADLGKTPAEYASNPLVASVIQEAGGVSAASAAAQ